MNIDVKNLTEEQTKVLGMVKENFKQKYGMSDADWDKFMSFPSNKKLVLNTPDMRRWRIVAECTESVNCGAGIKVGQKFKFETVPNIYLPDESTAPPCLKALGPIAELMHGIWERMFEGLDPNEGMGQYAACLDHGLEYGGIGHVVFKIYCELSENNNGK